MNPYLFGRAAVSRDFGSQACTANISPNLRSQFAVQPTNPSAEISEPVFCTDTPAQHCSGIRPEPCRKPCSSAPARKPGARPGPRFSCRGGGARFSAGFRADAGAMLCRSVGAEYRFGYFSRRIRGLHRELRTEVRANVGGACLRAEVSRNGGPPEKIGIHGSTGLLVWQVSARTAFAALSPRYDGMGGF